MGAKPQAGFIAELVGSGTNLATGTYYYPTAAGIAVGEDGFETVSAVLAATFPAAGDVMVVTKEWSPDGTAWFDATPSAVEALTQTAQNASYTLQSGGALNLWLDTERCRARRVRVKVAVTDDGSRSNTLAVWIIRSAQEIG